MEMKREADSNDITECLRDDKPSVGMFVYVFFSAVIFPVYYIFIFKETFLSERPDGVSTVPWKEGRCHSGISHAQTHFLPA